jgi:hypothetical protein
LEKQKQLFCSKTLTTISVQYNAFDVEWSKLKSKSTLHGGHPRHTTVGGDAGKEQGAIRFQFRPLHIESTVLHGDGGQGF